MMDTPEVRDEKIKENKDNIYEATQRVKWLEEHYNKFNTEMGTVQNDVKWIKKMLWWIIGIVISFDGIIIAIVIDHIYRSK